MSVNRETSILLQKETHLLMSGIFIFYFFYFYFFGVGGGGGG